MLLLLMERDEQGESPAHVRCSYTPTRPYERCQVVRLRGRGANALQVHREKVACYKKETTDVRNKVDKSRDTVLARLAVSSAGNKVWASYR
jgi:hypothetical protein